MRCKKHAADLTSAVGVCSSCLRERLTAIIEAQTRAQAQLQIQAQLSRLHSRNNGVAPEESQKSDPNPPPPPLIFPRSVSPYVSRRKSDDSAWPQHHHSRTDHDHDHSHQRHHIRFYSTPQVGPTYDGAAATIGGSYKKSKPRFSLLSSLFRSRSDKFWTDPRVSSRDAIATSASSPSWFSAIFAGKRGKKSKECFTDGSTVRVRSRHRRARGMSPDFTHDGGDVGCVDDCNPWESGSGDSSTPDWKRTPVQATPSRRTRSGPVKNVSGLTFCLSPLVRASPNPHWNQKGMQELGITGETRVATKPHLSSAASFSMNRSRKLADFGRVTSNR